jgi:hypothetical protein
MSLKIQIRSANTMASYFCLAHPFDLGHGKSAWRISHPDIVEEISCQCGSTCVLGSTQHPLDLEFCFKEYLDHYNYEKEHPECHQYLSKYRLLERKDVVQYEIKASPTPGSWVFTEHSRPLLLLDEARAKEPTNEELRPINL